MERTLFWWSGGGGMEYRIFSLNYPWNPILSGAVAEARHRYVSSDVMDMIGGKGVNIPSGFLI